MGKFRLVAVSLVALGVAIVMFEGLVANNRANFHPCSPGIICDFVVAQDPISIGVFSVISGAIMLGFHNPMKRKNSLNSTQR